MNFAAQCTVANRNELQLQFEHGLVFRSFLDLDLEEKISDLRIWLTSIETDSVRVLDRWHRFEIYRTLLPDSATNSEAAAFVSAVKTIVAMLTRQYILDDNRISEREGQILDLLGQGLTSKEIASRLSISFHTVSNHRRHIAQKTGASGAGLVAYAARRLSATEDSR